MTRERIMNRTTVRDNPVERRYEAVADGEVVGELRYVTEPGVIVLVHTEVAPSVEGHGIGSRLVGDALDDIRSRGLRVVPVCPFVAAFLRRHPEQHDLIARRTVRRSRRAERLLRPWDLLWRRRELPEARRDPDAARVWPPGVVERYDQ
jgi:predicted GNAT family acetyltransferase